MSSCLTFLKSSSISYIKKESNTFRPYPIFYTAFEFPMTTISNMTITERWSTIVFSSFSKTLSSAIFFTTVTLTVPLFITWRIQFFYTGSISSLSSLTFSNSTFTPGKFPIWTFDRKLISSLTIPNTWKSTSTSSKTIL